MYINYFYYCSVLNVSFEFFINVYIYVAVCYQIFINWFSVSGHLNDTSHENNFDSGFLKIINIIYKIIFPKIIYKVADRNLQAAYRGPKMRPIFIIYLLNYLAIAPNLA